MVENQRQRVSPKSREMEEALLAAIVQDNNLWDRIQGQIHQSDFSEKRNGQIFAAMDKLFSEGVAVNWLSLTEELRSRSQLGFEENSHYLQQLEQGFAFEGARVENFMRVIRDRAAMRRLIGIAEETIDDVYDPQGRSAKDLLDLAETRIFQLGNDYRNHEESGFQSARIVVADTLQYVQTLMNNNSAVTGLSTGFSELDQATAGLHSGELIIVGGRPSMGKTTFVMNIAENVSMGGYVTAVFSLEMPARALMMRLFSSMGAIPSNRMRIGNLDAREINRLQGAVNTLQKMPLFIDDSSHMTISEMRARCRRLQREQGHLHLVVVDYLQLMQPERSNDNRVNQMSDISRGLKLLAKELNVPVIALSQLNRALESRENKDKRPKLSDLRDSGAIEQDADVVMFVYRDTYYNSGERAEQKPGAEIIISKQRNGELGTIYLDFQGQFLRFSDRQIPQVQEESEF